MNPHTPYILVAYGTASLIMLVIVLLPILQGRRLRRQLRNRLAIETTRDNNSPPGTKS
ncbi:MAG: heme exporter protein CcmD [Xanthomonadales bacterium]|nr:heme exporter protein CcmD [Xanthomonadales bacterium]